MKLAACNHCRRFSFRQQDFQHRILSSRSNLKVFPPIASTSCKAEAFVMKTNLASALLDVSVRILSSTRFNLSLLIRFIAQSVVVIHLYMKGVPKQKSKRESILRWVLKVDKKRISNKKTSTVCLPMTHFFWGTYFHPDLIAVSMLPPNVHNFSLFCMSSSTLSVWELA